MTPNDEYRTLLTTLEHLNRLRVHLNPPITGEQFQDAMQKFHADYREKLDTAYKIQFATLDRGFGKRVTLPMSIFQRWDPYERSVVRIDDDETEQVHLVAIHPERLDMVDWGGIRGEAVNKAILGLPKAVAAMVVQSYHKWIGIVKQDEGAAQGNLWNPDLEASASKIQASGEPAPTGLNGHITEKGWYPDLEKCHSEIEDVVRMDEKSFDFSRGRSHFTHMRAGQHEALAEIMHHFDAWEAKHYTPSTS